MDKNAEVVEWYTRTTQNRLLHGLRVQVSPSAQKYMLQEIKFKKNNFKNIGILIFVLIVFFYGIFKSKDYFSGPIVNIISPKNWDTISTKTFFIEGNAKNVKSLKINGRNILIEENGNFKEEFISKYPYTLIVIDAFDKYNEKKEEILKVVYNN